MSSYRIELDDEYLKEILGDDIYSHISNHELIVNSKKKSISLNLFSDKEQSAIIDTSSIEKNILSFFPTVPDNMEVDIRIIDQHILIEKYSKELFENIKKFSSRTREFSRFTRNISSKENILSIEIGKNYFNTIRSIFSDIERHAVELFKRHSGIKDIRFNLSFFDDSDLINKHMEENRPKIEPKISIPKPAPKKKPLNKPKVSDNSNNKRFSNRKYKQKDIGNIKANENVETSGKILYYEDVKQTRNGRYIHSFVIADSHSAALICKKFAEFEKKIAKPGKWISVQGRVKYDTFSKENVLFLDNHTESQPMLRMDNHPTKRVELHLHTKMSMDDATCDINELVALAAHWGHKAVAITDHGVVQGFPTFHKACKNNDIKPIFGMEGYLYTGDPEKFNTKEGRKYVRHIIFLIKTDIGRKNLYKLVSTSHINTFYYRPLIMKEDIEKYREGLIIGSACERGELFQAIYNKESEEVIEEIISRYDYLEIQPITNNRFMIRSENHWVKDDQDLIDLNLEIVRLGEKYNKPVISTCDAHFIERSQGEFRKVLLANKGFKDFMFQPELYFRTTDEMLKEFSYLSDEKREEICITNPNKIADEIELIQPIPGGFHPPTIEKAEDKLLDMVYKNAKERYGDPLPKIVEDRIELEVHSITTYKFSTLFYLAHLLVGKSLEDGYLVGSRGSVGSSVVARFSNVTEVNPLPPHYVCKNCKYSEFFENIDIVGVDLDDKDCPKCGEKLIKDGFNIPFQVFMGFEGDKIPDIDLNFSGEYQSTIHKYVEELFGKDNTFKAGTLSMLKEGQCAMYLKKYLEKISPDGEAQELPRSEQIRLMTGFEGVKKTTGQHPGGIIVVPKTKEIYDFSPVNFPANKKNSGVITTHFDYHVMDEQLVKLDMLGHDDPTIIKHLVEMTGVDIYTIPLDDKKTMRQFTEVDSNAIPEFGTHFVKNMLSETHPTKFTELIRISGLSHGTDVWTNNAQDLIKEGNAELATVISVRDDIMNYLINMELEKKQAFTIMESVRKGRGLTPEMEKAMKDKNVPDWYIDSCKKIKYMFPKAHAVAYVVMAFRIAWFKVYYPLEFYSAYFGVRAFNSVNSTHLVNGKEYLESVINNLKNLGNEMTTTEKNSLGYLEVAYEAMERGIEFLEVDIYKSHYSRYLREEGKLRCPLTSLDGLGEKAALKIVEEREEVPFKTQIDLAKRCGLNKNVMNLLKEKNCFGELPEDNNLQLF